MTNTLAVHGHDIIDLVTSHPDGIRLSHLMEIVAERHGRMATFHTSSAAGMDFDGLMASLESQNKMRIKRGVVYPGGSPACEH